MDLTLPGTVSAPRACEKMPCGQCDSCTRKVMLKLASYALRDAETQEEGDPKATLLDLLALLGLPS